MASKPSAEPIPQIISPHENVSYCHKHVTTGRLVWLLKLMNCYKFNDFELFTAGRGGDPNFITYLAVQKGPANG